MISAAALCHGLSLSSPSPQQFTSKAGFGRCPRGLKHQQRNKNTQVRVITVRSAMAEASKQAIELVQWAFAEHPASWPAALVANAAIFTVGFPLLRSGLTWSGVFHAYILGTVLWRAFGGQGLLIAAIYFCLGTGATKIKMKQKQAEGIAEKRSGKRGPASVWGSGSAGIVCALCAIATSSGFAPQWKLAFVASFCTKLSDTISSEIGKAFGKTTYLVTDFSLVPRGTEGAVSLEGTAAGLLASVLLALSALMLDQVDVSGAVICVVASQLANLLESYIGATFQGRSGWEWLNNDLVNVLNIAAGASLSVLLSQLLISFSPL